MPWIQLRPSRRISESPLPALIIEVNIESWFPLTRKGINLAMGEIAHRNLLFLQHSPLSCP